MAQRGTHENLEADLSGHGVARQADDRSAGAIIIPADGAHAHDVPRPGGDVIEADRAERPEDLAHRVAAPIGDAAGRQDEVGAHQLVLDRLAQAGALVGNGGDTEGLGASIGDGGGQGVAVSVEHGAGARLAAGLDDLITDRNNNDARTRVDEHPVATHAGQERHLTRPDARARAEHGLTLRDVLGAAANVLTGRRGGTQGDLRDPMVGELEGNHGLGARGHGRAGRDTNRGARHEGGRVHRPGADLLGDGKRHRRLQGGPLAVTHAHGVPVTRGQVGDREVEGRLHVLREHAAHRVDKLDVERGHRVGDGHAVLVEVGNASHSCQSSSLERRNSLSSPPSAGSSRASVTLASRYPSLSPVSKRRSSMTTPYNPPPCSSGRSIMRAYPSVS